MLSCLSWSMRVIPTNSVSRDNADTMSAVVKLAEDRRVGASCPMTSPRDGSEPTCRARYSARSRAEGAACLVNYGLVSSLQLFKNQIKINHHHPPPPHHQFSLIFINNCQTLRLIRPDHVIFASVGPENEAKSVGPMKKRFLILRHARRFWSPNSDLSVGQSRAHCETFWRVKCMFTHRHITPMRFFG